MLGGMLMLYNHKVYLVGIYLRISKDDGDNEESESINARLALTYQNIGDNEKALKSFRRTFLLNPNLTSLKFDYANLLGNMNKNEEAIEQYKQYLVAFPDDANAYRNLGLVYKKIDNNELALFNFEKSYSKDSSNIETKKELAYSYHTKKDYVNALKFYDFALKSEPDNKELLANKALTLHAMNNYVAAIELYKEILENQPNERIEQNLAAASIAYAYNLYDKKDYGQAILYFEDAIELNSREASAYYGYAKANAEMGCTNVALSAYEKAVSLAPSNLEYAKELNDYRNKYKTEISESIERPEVATEPVLQIVPPIAEDAFKSVDTELSTYDLLLKKGDEAYKQQKYNEAIDCYTKAVVFTPSDKTTMLKIANIYKLIGNNSKAISFYDKIITIDENSTDAYFNKGLVFANQKKYDEAITCFEKVIELSPEYPYAYYSLALTYELKNMPDKAIEYYHLYTGIETDSKMLNIVNQKIKELEEANKD